MDQQWAGSGSAAFKDGAKAASWRRRRSEVGKRRYIIKKK